MVSDMDHSIHGPSLQSGINFNDELLGCNNLTLLFSSLSAGLKSVLSDSGLNNPL